MTAGTTGALPTLLLVHGAWHGAWCWERFTSWLEGRGYRVVAPDLRKHGADADRTGLRWTRIGDYAEDVAGVLRGLTGPVVVVGHSMGGLIVQKVLERHAAAGVVLLASVPPGGVLAGTLRTLRKHPLPFLKANLTLSLWPLVESPRVARDLLFTPETPEDDVRRHHARLQDEAYLGYLEMNGLVVPRPRRVRERTPGLPALVMGAEQDGIFTPDEVRRTALAYGTEAVLIPGSGHDLMLDVRWEEVAARIDAWVRAAVVG
jgi:pimeloyl-ACP methyl ester carboxylesterase